MSNNNSIVLFVCEHGSAKSTIAAAHFNKLAGERGFKARAVSRGTDPDESYPINVTAGLRADGLHVEELKPEKLTDRDIATAIRIVTFSELTPGRGVDVPVDDWSDVPSVSEDYEVARNEIATRVRSILDELWPDQSSRVDSNS